MNRRWGVLILPIALAAAVGLFFLLRRGGEKPSSSPAPAAHGSAHAAAPVAAKPDPARLVVTVKDAKGPVAGASVRFERGRGEVDVIVTGADGIARSGELEPGTWHVSASADGHEPGALKPRELHAGETIKEELVLEPGGRLLTGVVTDASSGPIGGARIDAAKLGGMARPGDAVASTLTTPDGHYKLTVAEGQLLVAASEPSYAPQSRFVEVGADGAKADFQLVPGGVIEGVVRDERTKEPVADAQVTAQRDAPAMSLGERAVHDIKTGSDGRFRITGLRPGAYELEATAAHVASRSPTIVGLGVAEQITDVEILVGAAPAIRGIVVDENGAPAAGVEVSAFGGPGNDASATSDAKGAFAIEGLGAGKYMLMGRSETFLPASTSQVELATKDLDGVKVNVRHGLRIKGHVERRQVCQVELELDVAGMPPPNMPMLLAPVTTGEDGEFDVGPAQPAAYTINARCPSGEQGQKKVDAKAVTADVIVEVKPGASIAGKVIDGQGKGVGGVAVMATPVGGMEHTTIVNGVVTSGVQALTNAAGAFELKGLAAGAYHLRVLDRGRPLPMKNDAKVSVTAVEHKTGVTLTVDRPDGVIRGVVTGADGKPIGDAWVSVHLELADMLAEAMDKEHGESRFVSVETQDDGGDTGGVPPALTDASGKFEIRNLARVPWTVVAEAQAGKLRGRADKVTPDADIKLQALGVTELKGKLVVPGGALPSSFEVELDGPTRAQRSFATADGTFSFARVDPGDYTVSVTSSAGNGKAAVKVLPGSAASVEITLAANAIVIGKLVDGSGKPAGGLPVTIIPDHGDGQMRVELTGPPLTSNPDGSFRLEAKAGPSILLVMTPPRPTSKRGLNLEAGKTTDVGTVTVAAPPPP